MKRFADLRPVCREWVAPFTGAWIETPVLADRNASANVAPFTGAWIETRLGW